MPLTPARIMARAQQAARHARHWAAIASAPRTVSATPRVSYGQRWVPGRNDLFYGGIVKFQRLQEHFPNHPEDYNVLYMGSSTIPRDWRQQAWLARRRKAAIAWNQNGVAYPGWHGPRIERTNGPFAKMLAEADHVFYQTAFCKACADDFAGPAKGTWEILHNAVDTRVFTPADDALAEKPLTLLLGGTQNEEYRLRSALEALAVVRRSRPDARLLVTGLLAWNDSGRPMDDAARKMAEDLGVADHVEWLGRYSQAEAPGIYRRAHLLVHTKYKDPCPSVVVEALASGLPVVHSASGGVPELVGPDAGVPVPVEDRWDRQVPLDPAALAEAILVAAERRPGLARAARERAVKALDLAHWVERHRIAFERLVQEENH